MSVTPTLPDTSQPFNYIEAQPNDTPTNNGLVIDNQEIQGTRYSFCNRTISCCSRPLQFRWTLTVGPRETQNSEDLDSSTSNQEASMTHPPLNGEALPLSLREADAPTPIKNGIGSRVVNCASKALSTLINSGAPGFLIGAGLVAAHHWSKSTQNS